MKILIVDDSKAMRGLVKRNLSQAGFDGHEISEAENGKEALQLVSQSPPDLILSDWNMPEMTGIQLLEEINRLINQNKLSKKIPFVFVTSEATEAVLKNAQYNGAVVLIPKPFSAQDFKDKLSSYIK